MDGAESPVASTRRRICEATFSFNAAYAFMPYFFHYEPAKLVESLWQMEIHINRVWLGHTHQDFFMGYYELFIPGTVLGLFLWTLLRLFSRKAWTEKLLRWAGGIAAGIAAPAVWLNSSSWAVFVYYPSESVLAFEAALFALCVVLYLFRKWPVPTWASVLLFCLHYAIWFWRFGTTPVNAYSGMLPPLISSCAGLGWALYVRPSRGNPGLAWRASS